MTNVEALGWVISILAAIGAFLVSQLPVRCTHKPGCAQCAVEVERKAERARRAREEYEHSIHMDRDVCPECGGFHCQHEPHKSERKNP